MPTLGFLKKNLKRPKDTSASKDAVSSQPNSPTTPTSAQDTTNPSPVITVQSSTGTAHSQAPAPPASTEIKQSNNPQESMAEVSKQQPASITPAAPSTGNGSNITHSATHVSPPQHDGAGQSSLAQIAAAKADLPDKQKTPIADKTTEGAHTARTATSDGLQQKPQPTAAQPTQPTQLRQTKGKYSLSDFEISRTLGTGSFGRVHLVQSKHNQRYYAVKVLKKAQVIKMKQVEHTNDERRMLQEVKHPFLITLWGTFFDAKNLYMVMDFVEGGELFSLLRKSQVSRAITGQNLIDHLLAIPQSGGEVLCG